ncbi:hypothetical protein [Alteraurantiacibacter palmitatis]|uniref:Uncharacterized protein n=1 Tax=Alteraurantiacibacter palmitatis TaxID=2054628 RepID=A0ABV7E3Y6_9SPHN
MRPILSLLSPRLRRRRRKSAIQPMSEQGRFELETMRRHREARAGADHRALEEPGS